MNENSPVLRQWEMLRLLACCADGAGVGEIAKKLHVSTRTIRRDLLTLQSVGIPIEEEIRKQGKKVWRFENPAVTPHLNLSYDEVAALAVGRRFLEPLMGTSVWEAASGGLKNIRNVLGPRAVLFLERMFDGIQNTKTGRSDYSRKPEIVEAILLGVEETRAVKVGYQSLKSNQTEFYVIHPYQTLFHRGTLYVIGWSEKARDIRHWKLDRMSEAIVLNDRFRRRPEWSKKEYAAEMFAVYHTHSREAVPIEVEIRFNREVARYVEEHYWNDSQQLYPTDDGGLILRMTLENTVELKSWIMSFGAHAVVLAPESLRSEMKEEWDRVRKNYD